MKKWITIKALIRKSKNMKGDMGFYVSLIRGDGFVVEVVDYLTWVF